MYLIKPTLGLSQISNFCYMCSWIIAAFDYRHTFYTQGILFSIYIFKDDAYTVYILHEWDAIKLNLSVDPSPTITLLPCGAIQTVGNPLVINCTVSTVSVVEPNLVMISWMKPEGISIISDRRVIISPTTSINNTYTSSLQFTYLMEGDEGTYTCNVKILENNGSRSAELWSLTGKYNKSNMHNCFSSCTVWILTT